MNEYIPLKDYAIKNRISIYQAIKLVKNNKVESITKEIDGKEVIYIKNSKPNIPKKDNKPKEITLQSLQEEIENLKNRVKVLEDKLNNKI